MAEEKKNGKNVGFGHSTRRWLESTHVGTRLGEWSTFRVNAHSGENARTQKARIKLFYWPAPTVAYSLYSIHLSMADCFLLRASDPGRTIFVLLRKNIRLEYNARLFGIENEGLDVDHEVML
ncbi:unnamed protein product, partial [Nesidiocoris tenuis]